MTGVETISPIFISVLYRSGSTLLCHILNQSNELKISCDTIHYLRFSFNKYNPIEKKYRELVLDTHNRIKEKWDDCLNVKEITDKISCFKKITNSVVYNEIMNSFLKIKKNERWGDRTAVNWEGMNDFINMFPNGKAIHIYRDPRAVLASFKKFTKHKGLMYLDSVFASLSMFNFIQSIKSFDKNIYLIKYENLVKEPEIEINKLCEFLGIAYSKKMLDVSSFKCKTGASGSNSSFTGSRDKIDDKSINIWNNYLNNVEIYLTEMVLRDKMVKFGYELTGIDLNLHEFNELHQMLHSDFLSKRYLYWIKNANGQQAYPDTLGAYNLN